jgi:putative ABC transport system substrate-binding protein
MSGLDRRHLLLAAPVAMAAPFLSRAHAQNRPHRIYMMLFRGWEEACDGFRDFFKSRDIAVDLIVRDARQQRAAIEEMVREAKQIRPDLVYLWGTTTAVVALGPWDATDKDRYITDLPCVFNIVTEPVANGIVPSLERTGRNATGTLYIVPAEIQMRTMTAYRAFRKIGAVFSPLETNSIQMMRSLQRVASETGTILIERPLAVEAGTRNVSVSSLRDNLAALKADGAEWIYIPPDTALQDRRMELTDTALELGLPTFAASERFVSFANALTGLVCRYYNIGQFTAYKADQILRLGKSPAEIPVETLNRFSFMINMRTANRLRFYPPLRMFRYAETV